MWSAKRNVATGMGFWLLLLLSVSVLALGSYAVRWPLDAETREKLISLHVSLGLAAAVLFVLQLAFVAILAMRGPGNGNRSPAATWLRRVIYVLVFAPIATGLAGAYYRGDALDFFGHPLAAWEFLDLGVADQLQMAHRFVGYALAAFFIAYVALAVAALLRPAPAESLSELAKPSFVMAETTPLAPASSSGGVDRVGPIIAEGLAQSFRFFGSAAFWIELFLGVVSAMLLAFGFVGHTVSPGSSGFSDAIYWASAALALLVFSGLFALKYIKTAKRLREEPAHYLGYQRRASFWFVGLGGGVSGLGVLISFIGVGLSVALLIGKTVSQPPGIAITDPSKIIRALDVFVLLVNFNLLFAHFVGFGFAAWLSISALKARHQYVVATENRDRAEDRSAESAA